MASGAVLERFEGDGGALRVRFLVLLAEGKSRSEASKALDLDPHWIRARIRTDDSLRIQVEEAEAIAVEPVEDALREAAMAGEPWAVRLFLDRADRRGLTNTPAERQGAVGDRPAQHLHLHMGTPDERVLAIVEQLTRRKEELKGLPSAP